MEEGTPPVATVDHTVGRAAAPWLVWNHLPEPVRIPSRALIALARRMRASSTALPPGEVPVLPPTAVELRTSLGGFWFDAADHKITPWIRRHATWEADVLKFLASAVRPGMVAVDVGANVGFHTVALSRLAGPAGRVHAFEPLPGTLELLRANLWRHSCANTVVHPVAALDRAGVVSFARDPEGDSGAHVELTAPSALQVPAARLEDTIAEESVDVLKIDVEGAEPLVLEGASRLIAASTHLVAVVEFRGTAHLDGRSPEEVLAAYAGLGFTTHRLAADGRAIPATTDELVTTAQRAETINIVLRR